MSTKKVVRTLVCPHTRLQVCRGRHDKALWLCLIRRFCTGRKHSRGYKELLTMQSPGEGMSDTWCPSASHETQ